MSRWHRQDCEEPKVRLGDDRIPRCDACGESAPLDRMMAEGQAANPLPPIPPDEPLDQMNLYWPRCVPYSRFDHASPSSSPSSSPPKTTTTLAPIAAPGPSLALSGEDPACPTYRPRLKDGEFRILWLPAAAPNHDDNDDDDDPIHCELENFSLDDCVEYETVSYAWGGEDGDSARTRPVFIGPFWDVCLQTGNCHDMLRNLRPYRGVRALWVDALCINQEDDRERSQQVASMAKIYRQCTRVVAFLQKAAVTRGDRPVSARRAPHRKDLKELFLENESAAHDLLGRRYFTRMWIIQELILPREVMLKIGDTEYSLRKIPGDTQNMLRKSEELSAAWFQYVTRRSIPAQNILDIFNLTSSCQASDLRDKLFAILGLLEPMGQVDDSSVTHIHALEVDYGLSCQQVFTGLFAYMLVVQKNYRLLKIACCLHGSWRQPSWVPAWRETASLCLTESSVKRRSWELPGPKVEYYTMHSVWRTCRLVPRVRDRKRSFKTLCALGDFIRHDVNYGEDGREDSSMIDLPNGDPVLVHPDTGGLSMTLVLLCRFSVAPEFSITRNGLSVFLIPGIHNKLCIWTRPEISLKDLVDPASDALFLLVTGDDFIPIILRPTNDTRDYTISSRPWKVVAVCETVSFERWQPEPTFSLDVYHRDAAGDTIPSQELSLDHLCYPVPLLVNRLQEKSSRPRYLECQAVGNLFHQLSKSWVPLSDADECPDGDANAHFQALINEENGLCPYESVFSALPMTGGGVEIIWGDLWSEQQPRTGNPALRRRLEDYLSWRNSDVYSLDMYIQLDWARKELVTADMVEKQLADPAGDRRSFRVGYDLEEFKRLMRSMGAMYEARRILRSVGIDSIGGSGSPDIGVGDDTSRSIDIDATCCLWPRDIVEDLGIIARNVRVHLI